MIKVVIIEDEDIIRKGLMYTFDWISSGCIVAGEADNGADGIKLIEEVKPDLVITDIRMPMVDGLQMLCTVKGSGEFETIIISSFAEFEYAKKAIELKVFDYLLKPIDEDRLKEIIEKVKVKIEEKKAFSNLKDKIKEKNEVKIIDVEYYTQTQNPKSKYTLGAIDYIVKFYKMKISIDDIAEKMDISSSYLSRKFKEETQHTFNDFLNQYRIQKSVELLMTGDYKVYEVADMVGFSDYKYFAQVFKQYMNYAPLEFIKSECFIREK